MIPHSKGYCSSRIREDASALQLPTIISQKGTQNRNHRNVFEPTLTAITLLGGLGGER